MTSEGLDEMAHAAKAEEAAAINSGGLEAQIGLFNGQEEKVNVTLEQAHLSNAPRVESR